MARRKRSTSALICGKSKGFESSGWAARKARAAWGVVNPRL